MNVVLSSRKVVCVNDLCVVLNAKVVSGALVGNGWCGERFCGGGDDAGACSADGFAGVRSRRNGET